MTYSEIKAKIQAARNITENSPFKLERGYIYATETQALSRCNGKPLTGLISKRFSFGIDFSVKKRIYGVDKYNKLVEI